MTNPFRLFIGAAALTLVTSPAMAGQVTGLTSFTAGTPAKAAEVNANFDAVKAAVDDNDARVTNLQSSKQSRVTGTCAVGSAVTAIAADGSVTCGQALTAGFVSVGNDAFSSRSERASQTAACAYDHDTADEAGWFSGTSTTLCTAKAAVSLPHQVTLTGLSCRVLDDLSGNPRFNVIKLSRTDLQTNTTVDVFATGSSGDCATLGCIQWLSDTTPSSGAAAVVHNDLYVYRLRAEFNGFNDGTTTFDSVGAGLRLYGCTIAYQP